MMADVPEIATILLAVDGPVGVITPNRPDRRNAWTLILARELPEALD
jgi:enoyl-CoA hydratase/carnithine racemase